MCQICFEMYSCINSISSPVINPRTFKYLQINIQNMSSSIILAGLGMAAVGFGGRYIARTMPHLAKKAEEVV